MISLRRFVTQFAGLSSLALLAACSSHHASLSPSQQAARYAAQAHGKYSPPGPPSDPWGPYIEQASTRFDVPTKWIRQVMRVESGGHEYMHGHLTVSGAGAMGLMQLEPETYQEMASRYGLGSDPFNPYNNIMAGTAYIHEMYEIYGSPGFLAAYNAGPGRLDNYLDYKQPLPAQTRNYVAMIAPHIAGVYPAGRSQAEQVAMNQVPAHIAPGLRPAGQSSAAKLNRAQLAIRRPAPAPQAPPPKPAPAPVRMAALTPSTATEPRRAVVRQTSHTTQPLRPHNFSFSLIPSAEAAAPVMDGPVPTTAPQKHGPIREASSRVMARPTERSAVAHTTPVGRWGIQVGAYNSPGHAKAALGIAELAAVAMLMKGQPVVQPISTAHGRFFRARFVNLGHEDAVNACRRLNGGATGCEVLSPDAN